MAENIKRISSKSEITMGTGNTNLSGNDLLLTQHTTGDNNDYGVPIKYVQAIPVGETDTASATSTKVVTLINYPASYEPVIGTKILVKFNNANTSSSQISLTVGSITKPCTVKGFALKSPIPKGSQIEFTYTGTSFNCQDFAISTLDTSSLQPVNSSAINGALADYGNYKDTRNVNEPPSYYYQNYPLQVVREFKTSAVLGIGGDTYCSLSTYVDWRDASVGISQIALSGNALYKRYSVDSNTWGQWQEFVTKSDLTKYRGILEKRVKLNVGANIISLDTNSCYLLVATGNNYGMGVCLIVQGWNTAVIKNTLISNNIDFGSSDYATAQTLTVTNNGGGQIDLDVIRF